MERTRIRNFIPKDKKLFQRYKKPFRKVDGTSLLEVDNTSFRRLMKYKLPNSLLNFFVLRGANGNA